MNRIATQALARNLARLELPDGEPSTTTEICDMPSVSPTYNSREAEKFVVRMPDGLRERVAERAEHEGRSMNSVVVRAVEHALEAKDRLETMLGAVALLKQQLQEELADVQGGQQ